MQNDTPKLLADLMDAGSTLMVGSPVSGQMEFRPLTVARIDGDDIQILLDTRETWVAELPDGTEVQVTMSDDRHNTWVWLRGTASRTTSPVLIDELWNPFAAAYFDEGRDTEGIAVLRIDVADGRYWSTAAGRLGALVSMIKAKLGRPEQAGQHGAITTS